MMMGIFKSARIVTSGSEDLEEVFNGPVMAAHAFVYERGVPSLRRQPAQACGRCCGHSAESALAVGVASMEQGRGKQQTCEILFIRRCFVPLGIDMPECGSLPGHPRPTGGIRRP
jgi:hypothetical protein